ncbi:TRAF3-interacting JNK-activating modulator isoform X1 [Lissotriton helveticus]
MGGRQAPGAYLCKTHTRLPDLLNQQDLYETFLDMTSKAARSPPGHQRLLETYEEKCERRLEIHEIMRSRVNITSCRLMEKDWGRETEEGLSLSPRQQEYSRRRKLEFEEEQRKRSRVSPRSPTSSRRAVPMQDNRRTWNWKDAGCTNSQLLWNNNIAGTHLQHAPFAINMASSKGGFPTNGLSCTLTVTTATSRERGTQTAAESIPVRMNSTRDSSQQTDCGTAVLDKEMFQLSEYLKEALHRELKLKKKLAILQELLTALIQAAENSWKSQLNEDRLNCKVGALEQKLQIYSQNYQRDGVKRILLEMEDNKLKYEEKAKESVKKILEDKIIAEKQLQNIQRSFDVTEDECFLWKEEYEKLKGEWGELAAKHVELQSELHILQSKLQWVESQDLQLRKFQSRLQCFERERAEMQSQIEVLEDDNNLKREQLNSMAGRLRSTEDEKLALESRLNHLESDFLSIQSQPPASLQTQPSLPKKQKNNREEHQHQAKLRRIDSRLVAKEKECADLQSELDCLSQEYLFCQTKLRECRNQIKTFQAKRSKGCCSSCLFPCLMIFLAIATALFYITVLQHSFIR